MAKTITLKINERSSFGKTILELIEIAVREKKGVEVIHKPNNETLKAIRNTEKGIGLTKTVSHEDLMQKLNS